MNDQDTLDALLRSNFGTFCHKVFNTLNSAPSFKPNWHIDAVIHHLDQARLGHTKRLIINMPPRSLKSVLASVALPAFILGHDPTARLICVSYAQPLAAKLARDFRRVLESDWYKRIFPHTIVSKDAEEMIETSAGGARFSTSVGAAVTGLGGRIIIVDDPMKPEDAASQAGRDRVVRYYGETLYSRLDSKADGVIIVVMQRLHEDDLAGHLLRNKDWKHLSLPATAAAEAVIPLGDGRSHTRRVGDVLHPEREPDWVLDELRRNLGSAAFEAQYQQAPIPEAGNMVKREWLPSYRPPLDHTGMKIAQSWDTALKATTTADFSVCTTWAERNGKHYLLEVFRKQLDFPGVIKAALSLYQRYRPHAVLIEDQGAGTALIQQLRAAYHIHPIPRRSKDDKATRLSIVLPAFEAGTVVFPHDAEWLPQLLHELLGFPQTRHDDQVDSISQYLGWARDKSSRLFVADFGFYESPPNMDAIGEAILSSPRYRW
jgi:predicted phage terminase large subunit-like protein